MSDEPKVRTIDMVLEGQLAPPPADVCQQCAVTHEPEMPHNQQSLFWQYWFYKQSGGHWPTWHDAMAHCTDEMKAFWVEQLTARGVSL